MSQGADGVVRNQVSIPVGGRNRSILGTVLSEMKPRSYSLDLKVTTVFQMKQSSDSGSLESLITKRNTKSLALGSKTQIFLCSRTVVQGQHSKVGFTLNRGTDLICTTLRCARKQHRHAKYQPAPPQACGEQLAAPQGWDILVTLLGDVEPVGEAGQEGLHDHRVHCQASFQAPGP